MTDSVKERFCEQRDAIDGEPRCTICGRYGEYICDETEDDICSLECKHILLSKLAKSRSPIKLPATDDCFYVKDTHSSKVSASPSLVNDQTLLLREKLKISVRGASIPPPILSFASCSKIPQMLQTNLEAAEFEIPTSVQMQAIPAAMTGQSLLVSAATGSGKTASYLVPIISRCADFFNNSRFSKNPLAIVLAPTREICIQVEEQAKLLGKGLPFKTALVVGGDPMPPQIHRINEGASLIIATPGRLIHLLTKNSSIELDTVSILVLDEVDCMLQRGFFEQVMQIYRALSQPQILMYSATISKEIEKMASGMAKDLSVISIGIPNKPNEAVKQVVIWVEDKQKKQKLIDILTSKQHFLPPIIVFVGSKLGADLLCEAITVSTRLTAVSIHGDKSMKERRETLKSFLVGEIPVIVATGVLGRGVDLLNVRQVIIFDIPNSIKEYVHQIGRAREGKAIVFVNEENKKIFSEFVELLKSSSAPIPRELANSRYLVNSSSVRGNKKPKHG